MLLRDPGLGFFLGLTIIAVLRVLLLSVLLGAFGAGGWFGLSGDFFTADDEEVIVLVFLDFLDT